MAWEVAITGLEKLVDDPKLYLSRANRRALKLESGLIISGFEVEDLKFNFENVPRLKAGLVKHGGDVMHWQMGCSLPSLDVPRSTGFHQEQLIHNIRYELFRNNFYRFKAHMNIESQQPIVMYMHVAPRDNDRYRLVLLMQGSLHTDEPILLEDLTYNITSVGFQYDLSNPNFKNYLSNFAQTRISSNFVASEIRSLGVGIKTPNGFDTKVQLYLQDPSDTYSDCYEAEAFSNGKKIDPTKLFPDAEWQRLQNHYCTHKPTIRRIPADIDETSRLKMIIDYNGSSTVLTDLFNGLLLSNDGTNQWYAKGPFGNGNLEIMFKPEWGEDNTALVYTQNSSTRITPNQIYEAAEGMLAVKGTLVERLAA